MLNNLKEKRELIRKWEPIRTCSTYSTQGKFAYNTSSSPTGIAPILNSRGSRILVECIKLKLRLVTNLRGKTLVSCYVEVCPSKNFIVFHHLTCLHIPHNSDILCKLRHRSSFVPKENEWLTRKGNRSVEYEYESMSTYWVGEEMSQFGVPSENQYYIM